VTLKTATGFTFLFMVAALAFSGSMTWALAQVRKTPPIGGLRDRWCDKLITFDTAAAKEQL
jgi:hypothetical protein